MANSNIVRNRRPNLSELSIKKDIDGELNGSVSALELTLSLSHLEVIGLSRQNYLDLPCY